MWQKETFSCVSLNCPPSICQHYVNQLDITSINLIEMIDTISQSEDGSDDIEEVHLFKSTCDYIEEDLYNGPEELNDDGLVVYVCSKLY